MFKYKISLSLFILSLTFFYCKQRKWSNELKYKFNSSISNNKLKFTDLLDSINFIQLDNSELKLGYPLERFHVRNGKYLIAWNESGGYGKCGLFDPKGNLIAHLTSNSDPKLAIGSISDLDLLKDTLFVLSGTKLYKINVNNNSVLEQLNFGEMFSTFRSTEYGLAMFSQMNSEYAVNMFDSRGRFMKGLINLKELPTFISDDFRHFSVFDHKSDLFYCNLSRDIYKIDYQLMNSEILISMDFGVNQLNNKTLYEYLKSAGADHEMQDKLFNKEGKFNFYSKVFNLKSLYFINFKLNKKTYYSLLNKKSQNLVSYSTIDNDTGLNFLTNKFGAIQFMEGINEALYSIAYPESIHQAILNNNNQSSIKIKSNWNAFKEILNSNGNPVVVIYYLKKF
ncbi:MAG TPA: hypothetical protein PKM27_14000 [Saprospiraceae bacterium]|nr:hypothetical protein [Saprospiraceae bacterium]HNT21945.1 hypothetical protein [Saprospiraceae bacterium]